MRRRMFFKYAGAGILLLGASSALFPARGDMDRSWRRKSYKPEQAGEFSADEIEILFLATLAPSGHNTQPWRIQKKEPGKWVIGSDKSRWLPAVDPQNRELLLSIGAFLENAVKAAHLYGYNTELTTISEDSFAENLVELAFKKGSIQGNSDKRLALRRTIRSSHLQKELLASDLDYLTTGAHQEQFLYYSFDSPQGKYLAAGTLAANRAQAFRDAAQLELADWIRWSHSDERKYRNGLTPESMELGAIARWYVKNFYTKQSALEKNFREEAVAMTKKQVESCGGWLLVISPSQSVSDIITAGRILEQAWLRASDKKIAFHPMTQMLEESPWKETIRQDLGISEQIQFIIRVSYVENYPQPVSLRMPLAAIIK